MKTVGKAHLYPDSRMDTSGVRLAGGAGALPANQNAEALLRRAVMACLLWENLFYEKGNDVAENIKSLIPQVDATVCYNIAVEASELQKLRHVPLYIVAVMAGLETHKHLVGELLARVVRRADMLAEFVSLYWIVNGKRAPLSKQVKVGLSNAFGKFNEYNFAKYRGDKDVIKLKDVLSLVHPRPSDSVRSDLYKRILSGELVTPDTWEVALSSGADKRATWERLIQENKLGALAFLRNLRNMEEAKVSHAIIEKGFESINPAWLLPLNYLSASEHAPRWESEIEKLMFKGLSMQKKLSGKTVIIVDVSGSTESGHISGKSEYTFMAVEAILAMIAVEMSEKSLVYATAGNDSTRIHSTVLLPSRRGFGLINEIKHAPRTVGGGGIFTRQALEWVKADMQGEIPERIIVLSDSQDCDYEEKRVPSPFGKYNYIIDVSSHARGVNFDGVWDAEISGWSEHFIRFIASHEGLNLQEVSEE